MLLEDEQYVHDTLRTVIVDEQIVIFNATGVDEGTGVGDATGCMQAAERRHGPTVAARRLCRSWSWARPTARTRRRGNSDGRRSEGPPWHRDDIALMRDERHGCAGRSTKESNFCTRWAQKRLTKGGLIERRIEVSAPALLDHRSVDDLVVTSGCGTLPSAGRRI